MGAICGGADPKDAQYLYEFGIGVGLAFQLKDDLLDVYGDTKDFGKEIGGDICCNKKTFLLISALTQADAKGKKTLSEWLNKTSFDRAEKIAAVTRIYDELRIRHLTESKMKEYYDQAIDALRKVNTNENRKEDLYKLAEHLLYRIS